MPSFILSILDRGSTWLYIGDWNMFLICFILVVSIFSLRYLRPSPPRRAKLLPPKAELGLQTLAECKEPNIDIVAVHGLGANPDYAWVWRPENNPPNSPGYPDKPFNWLQELLPAKLPCRVLAFNYDSRWLLNAPQQRLSHISDSLLDSLRHSRDQAGQRPLIFIGHSFGGNVIEQAIVSASRHGSHYPSIAESTVGVIFLGTPHRGSQAASWGALITSHSPPGFTTEGRLLNDLEQASVSQMDRLRDFSHWLFFNSVPVVCAFEKNLTDYTSRTGFVGKLIPSKTLVVPEESACIDGHHKISLHTDHLKINKFYGADDPSFKLIYPQIERMAERANETLERRRNPKMIPMDESSTSNELKKCLRKMRVANPLDVLARVQTQKGERVGRTCEWILKRPEFASWASSSESRFLRLIGSPGIGKTMMSTFLVDFFKTKIQKSLDSVFAYFFCDDKDKDRKTPTAILRSLIWQLLLQRNELFRHVQPDFEKHTNDSVFEDFFSNFLALWRVFQCMLLDECAGEVFILIDALDESESSTRQDLLDSIRKLFRPSPAESSRKIKLLITCRPGISDIERSLKVVGTNLRMDSADINDDLSEYIDFRVNTLTDMNGDEYSQRLKDKVRGTLREEAGGTFLWVSLMLAELGSVLMNEVEKRLKDLPRGLDNTYTTILDRISTEHRETAQFILCCMVAARRPLRKPEIQAAFAAWKKGSLRDDEDFAVYQDILSVCSSILYVGSEDDATINFCHQSVKDFLLYKPPKDSPWYHTTEAEANLLIFQVCWKYLSGPVFSHKLVEIIQDARRISPYRLLQQSLLDYSSHQWGNHAVASYPALRDDVEKLSIDVTEAPALRDSWLLRTSREGQLAIISLLLDRGANIEAVDKHHHTALLWATLKGQEAVVELLLDRGANTEAMDQSDRTALSLAAERGQEAVVKLLLDRSANTEAVGLFGRTALSWAAEEGQEAVVKLLLDGGANIEGLGLFGRTVLSCVAEKGQEAVVKLLLDRGANIEAMDQSGRTALLWAVEKGQEAVVELLLDRGANTEVMDLFGQTALSGAAEEGQKNVVKLLLDKGANTETVDQSGRTALLRAARDGREAVVKLLLDRGANIEGMDLFGRTALSWAAEKGQEAVVELLLDRGASIEAMDRFGRMALVRASRDGREAVVKLLLDRGANIEAMDRSGKTALSWAAKKGQKAVVELLLDRSANIEAVDQSGRTALSWAAEEGQEAVVKLLLDRGDNIKAVDQSGRTALSWAAKKSSEEAVVKLLLDRGANIEAMDQSGQAALS